MRKPTATGSQHHSEVTNLTYSTYSKADYMCYRLQAGLQTELALVTGYWSGPLGSDSL